MERIRKVLIKGKQYAILDGGSRAAIAPEYDEDIIYTYGDIVFHEEKLYMMSSRENDDQTTGEWDSESWTEVDLTQWLGWTLSQKDIYEDAFWADIRFNIIQYDENTACSEDAFAVGNGIRIVRDYEAIANNDYIVSVDFPSEPDSEPSEFVPIPQVMEQSIIIRDDGSKWVKIYFTRRDGQPITESDLEAIESSYYIRLLNPSSYQTNAALYHLASDEYTKELYGHDTPLTFYDYRKPFGSFDPGPESPYTRWSDWIPIDGGCLVETYFHEEYMVAAVYETPDGELWPIRRMDIQVNRPTRNGWVYVPGVIRDVGYEGLVTAKLKAIQIAFDSVMPGGLALGIYVKSDSSGDDVTVRKLAPNNEAAVKQFLDVAEGWYDYFMPRSIALEIGADVLIGAPTNIDKKTNYYGIVGVDSAYFVLCCLKGLTAGSDEWLSWNRDMLLSYKNPDYPWAENPSEYYNDSNEPTDYIKEA